MDNEIVVNESAVEAAPHFTPQGEIAAPKESARPAFVYTAADRAAAWVCLLVGYLFNCVTLFSSGDHIPPLGGALFTVGLFTAALLFFGVQRKLTLQSTAVALSGVAAGCSLLLTANAFLQFLAFVYAAVAFLYLVYCATGSRLEKGLPSLLFADLFRALFILPFASFPFLFPALKGGRRNKGGRVFLKILIGLAIAIVPTAIVISLLSYDEGFRGILDSIFDFDAIVQHLFRLLLGIPVAMYLFGLYNSGRQGRCTGVMAAAQCHAAAKKARVAPAATLLAATLPMLALYVVFFISQWKYYVSGFLGVLPEGSFAYAQYAREGFFQLCAVAAINLGVVILVHLLARRREEKPGAIARLIVTLFTLSTLVLLATAAAKMALYVSRFGLTPMRVYASWFMAVIAVLFLLILIRQFVQRFPVMPVSAATVVVLFLVLTLSGADGLIARYNVDRYLSGSLAEVDMNAMRELGDEALPALCDLKTALNARTDRKSAMLYKEVDRYLMQEAERIKEGEDGVFSVDLPMLRAESALRDAGYLK